MPQGQSPVPAQVAPPPAGTSSCEEDRYDCTDEEAAGVTRTKQAGYTEVVSLHVDEGLKGTRRNER